MSPESSLWRLVKNNLPGHLCRIENVVGVGCPDVNACYKGNEVWLEMKVCKGNFVYFKASQVAWFQQRMKEKGNAKFVIQWNYYKKGQRVPHLLVVHGHTFLDAQEHWVSMKNKSIRVLVSEFFTEDSYCFSKPYDWKLVRKAIFAP